ncbi:rod shape-determining protein MreC [Olsenella massiliensis]|uniref:rod shape-determining protein MreC n=1 Tax=Olsenella massiliensis TaxID=1622075 RepID=UPI000AE1ED33|nr:rod shape-determining protein MreC [Olsenella massiliensis]
MPDLRRSDSDSGARLFVVLLALSLVMFTMSARENGSGPFTAVRGGFMTVTTPIRYVGSMLTVPFQGIGNVVGNLTAGQETLSDLRGQNERLQAENARLREEAQAAGRLQDLLKLQSSYDLQSTAARIIAASTDSWSRTVVIDKGTSSGFAVGMPVTDSTGVIGQIVECGATSSTVRLLGDENSSVSAMIQSSRAHGVLTGSADGTLRLTLISADQSVSVGDSVVTSGLGGVYPKGLPIGRVLSVNKSEGDLYYSIVVEPLSSTESFEEVLVITSLTEGQKASADDIAAADAQDASVVSEAAPPADETDAGPKDAAGTTAASSAT